MAAAISCAQLLLSNDAIVLGISRISDVNIRQRLLNISGLYMFDDSYNASYESIIADFDLLYNTYPNFYKSVLLGSVMELGEHSERIHFKLGVEAAKRKFERLYFIGQFAHIMARGAIHGGYNSRYIFVNPNESDKRTTAKQILLEHKENEIILLKASNRVQLWDIIPILKELLSEVQSE